MSPMSNIVPLLLYYQIIFYKFFLQVKYQVGDTEYRGNVFGPNEQGKIPVKEAGWTLSPHLARNFMDSIPVCIW